MAISRRLLFYYTLISVLLVGCNPQLIQQHQETSKYQYPETRKIDHVDDYHGTIVPDPYRWLEDLDSEEVLNWAHQQQAVTQSYLDKIEISNSIEDRLIKHWDYPKMTTPFRKKGRYFFYRNTGLQNHSILYYQDSLLGEEKVLLDPNTFSEDGSSSLSMLSISKDGKLCAYGISKSGSDWDEYFVKNIDTGELYDDHLKWIKFSWASWAPDGSGFYYSRYDAPEGTDPYEEQNQFNKLYFHKIETDQSTDQLIYENPEHPDYGFGAGVTDDEKFLIMYVWSGANNNSLLYYRPYRSESDFIPIIDEWLGQFSVVHNVGYNFYIYTKYQAPNGKFMKMDPLQPAFENWTTIIPENENVLRNVRVVDHNKLIGLYRENMVSVVKIFEMDGEYISDMALPSLGSIGISAGWDDTEFFYSFSSFLYPRSIFKFDMETMKSTLFWSPDLEFEPNHYNVELKFYISRDETHIPMFIIHKKDLVLNGMNPTYLYGYGGFNSSVSPYFSVSRLAWLEEGGVLALPGLRGGSEYGEKWHEDGMLDKKQNVFDDFISAAEYLISENYTSPQYLAIGGGSNGGLLVSACMLQRPDLFRVVNCGVPVTDMLRYHKFTIGWAWVPEYGSSEDPDQFEFLYQYSPVHNVKANSKYPSMLISTGDHDDRVVPSHSYKLIAELQSKNTSDNPMFLRVHSKSGHGAGKPTRQIIHEQAQTWGFILHEMGISR